MSSGFNKKYLKYPLSPQPEEKYLEDCKRVQLAFLREKGIIINLSEAYYVWKSYSDNSTKPLSYWVVPPYKLNLITGVLFEEEY